MKSYRFNLLRRKKNMLPESFSSFLSVVLIFLNFFQVLFCVYAGVRSFRARTSVKNISRSERKRLEEAKQISKILPKVSFRMASLFSSLEKNLPEGARIIQIEVNRSGRVSLRGECKTALDLKILLERLSSKPFGNVMLERQGTKNDILFFTLGCSYEQ